MTAPSPAEPGANAPRTPLVDYNAAAIRYQAGRAINDEALNGWWEAVKPLMPPPPRPVVLDLGAGTGIFTRAWTRWCQCLVIAIEPSEGMRAEAARQDVAPGEAWVASVGEALPVRDGSVHVGWLSTVFHQLRDRKACLDELRRVLVPDGVVFVRGFFADRGEVGWLRFFPGAGAERTRFPSAVLTAELFEQCGFGLVEAREVDVRAYDTPRAAALWVRKMRRADTLLGGFSDKDFEAGAAALDAAPNEALANSLTLLAFKSR